MRLLCYSLLVPQNPHFPRDIQSQLEETEFNLLIARVAVALHDFSLAGVSGVRPYYYDRGNDLVPQQRRRGKTGSMIEYLPEVKLELISRGLGMVIRTRSRTPPGHELLASQLFRDCFLSISISFCCTSN